MTLFQDKERSYSGPGRFGEGLYDFLDRSSRMRSARLREKLNTFVAQCPEDMQRDIVGRVRDRDQQNSALLELFLYNEFLDSGFGPVPHPEKETSNRTKPDFLLKQPYRRLVEVTLIKDVDTQKTLEEFRLNEIVDYINLHCADIPFYVSVDVKCVSRQDVRLSEIRRNIMSWVGGRSRQRKFIYDQGGNIIEIKKGPRKGHPANRPVLTFGTPAVFKFHTSGIQKKLDEKARLYKGTSVPFILLVYVDPSLWFLDQSDIKLAVMGDSTIGVRSFWDGSFGSHHTHISSVRLLTRLDFFHPSLEFVDYINPSAKYPLTPI